MLNGLKPYHYLTYVMEKMKDLVYILVREYRCSGGMGFFLSIPWLQSHSIRYREPSIPNDRAT